MAEILYGLFLNHDRDFGWVFDTQEEMDRFAEKKVRELVSEGAAAHGGWDECEFRIVRVTDFVITPTNYYYGKAVVVATGYPLGKP